MAIVPSHEIVLDNGQRFYYTVRPFEMKNSLGKVIGILQEYEIHSSSEMFDEFPYKLYKTKEGNWYEIESENSGTNKIVRELKSIISALESDFENNEIKNRILF